MEVLTSEEQGLLLNRSRLTGVPPEISGPIIALFFKWCEGSGIEWSVQRLKSVKVDFLRKKAGLPKTSQWVKSGKGSSFFGGPLGALETWCFTNKARFSQTVALLNLYTALFAPRVTLAQGGKFVAGVTAKAITLPSSVEEIIHTGILLSGLKPVRKLPTFRPLITFQASSSKRAPTIWGSGPEDEGVIDSIAYMANGAGLRHLLDHFEFYRPLFQGLEPELDWLVHRYTATAVRSNPLPERGSFEVGRIGLIQEAGYKLRAVANPGRIFQRVLEPFGKVLFAAIKTLPWDCTFDQNKADIAILDRLQSGNKVHSVDLTGATDYFPLDLQKFVLSHIFKKYSNYVNLFIEISRGEWSVPSGFPPELLSQRTTLTWTKGQPLGLFPSFASFAMTHGILLLGLLAKEWDGEFFILGDDVVILDDGLYEKYRAVLVTLDCPVSESKTLSSSTLAEFRSVIFTDNVVIPQHKWRRLSDDSFIDVIRLNPYVTPMLLPRQRKVIELISGLPLELGGLGWNPKGLSLEVRLRPFWSVILKEYVPVDRLMSYNGLTRNLVYKSRVSHMSSIVSGVSRRLDDKAFDQNAIAYVKDLLGGEFMPLYEILGRNLDKIVNGNIDIPILGSDSLMRVTRLIQWENTLRVIGLLS